MVIAICLPVWEAGAAEQDAGTSSDLGTAPKPRSSCMRLAGRYTPFLDTSPASSASTCTSTSPTAWRPRFSRTRRSRDYPFSTGQISPDGVATFHYDQERDRPGDSRRCGPLGLAAVRGREPGQVSRNEAVACWWAKLGPVETSPDTGPYGGRAQRVASSRSRARGSCSGRGCLCTGSGSTRSRCGCARRTSMH